MPAEVFFNPAYYQFNWFAMPGIFVGVSVLILGIAVMLQEKGSGISTVFFFLTATAASWLLGYSAVFSVLHPLLALVMTRMIHISVSFIPSLIFLFTSMILNRERAYRLPIAIGFLVSTFFALFSVASDYFVRGTYRYFWGPYAKFGVLGVPFLIFFFVTLFVSFLILIRAYYLLDANTLHKKRLRVFLIAFSVGYIACVDYIANFGLVFYPFGYAAVLAFTGISAHGIRRYHLTDITPAFASGEIIKMMNDALLVFDSDGRARLVNRAASELLGKPEKHLLGKTGQEIMGDVVFSEVFAEISKKEVIMDREWILWTALGKKKILSYSCSAKKDDHGNIAFYVFLIHDITQRKLTQEELENALKERTVELRSSNDKLILELQERQVVEQALRESREMFYRFMNHSPVMAYIKDERGQYVYVNEPLEKRFSITLEWLKNKTDFDWLPPRIAREVRNNDIAVMSSDKVVEFVEMVPTPDGATRFWLSFKFPFIDQSGKRFLGGVSVDITEKKQIEEMRARYSAIVESSSDAIISESLDGTITGWNKGAEDLYGFSSEEAVGQPISIIFPEDHHEELLSILEEIRLGKKMTHYETVRQKKGGELVDVSVAISPIIDDDGDVIGASSIARDISLKKKIDQEIRAAIQMKSDFISTVSHELRTPLVVIKEGVRGVLSEAYGSLNDRQRKDLTRIKNNADRLARLIDDVLDFQKMESGLVRFHMVARDINAMIKEAVETMEPIAQKKHLSVALHLPSDAPRVVCDKDKIMQVLINLLQNAVKFTSEGVISIIAEVSDGFLRVRVIDQGIGIREEDKAKLFKSFSQLGEVAHRTEGGTGLGLAICKSIIEKHGGQIQVKSVFGKGSEFYFTLPLQTEIKQES